MRDGDTKMSSEQIEEIIRMRTEGYSYSAIGRHMGRDHTTIIFQCRKAGFQLIQGKNKSPTPFVKPKEKPAPVPEPKPPMDLYADDDVRNPGKNYIDYLEEEKKRDWKKRKDMAPPAEQLLYSHPILTDENKL